MFEQELQKLEAQHREELRNVRRNYHRAVRSLSPRRMIRKHPVIALSSAAAVGVLVAPSWSKSRRREETEVRPARTRANWVGVMLRLVLRKMRVGLGTLRPAVSNGHPKPQGLPEAMTQLLERLGTTMMIFKSVGQSFSRPMPGDGSGTGAEFAVGDGGTVQGTAAAGGWNMPEPAARETAGV